uniref:WRKY53-superfamily of TFs having WRKY and zinc finger domains n=1 Tax=Arundo donax TaxID=35708 RepID=A0A0A9F4T8_ARUDO
MADGGPGCWPWRWRRPAALGPARGWRRRGRRGRRGCACPRRW